MNDDQPPSTRARVRAGLHVPKPSIPLSPFPGTVPTAR